MKTPKKYIQKPDVHEFYQWDGVSIDAMRKIFSYLDVSWVRTVDDFAPTALLVDYPLDHPSRGYWRPEIIRIGDYVAVPMHSVSGLSIINIAKERFEQIYMEEK